MPSIIIKKYLFCLAILSVFAARAASPQLHTFEIKDGNFLYDNKPVQILSGEIHYARIPHQYWRHRLKMLKAMGLNTVATYVFWNMHEPEPNKWDFEGDKNLSEFVKTAAEEGLWVILRPGPYACAEWEFGGYPWWLQNCNNIELRRDNPVFLQYTQAYIARLYQEIGKLQISKGGPIIMIQVENEFGSYVAQRKDIPNEEHKAYNRKIKNQILAAGFQVPLFSSDGSWLFDGGSLEGVLPTANGENSVANLKKAVNNYHGGKGPYMVAEYYPGWLSHWDEPFPQVAASAVARKLDEFLRNGISFNLYMAHGGTNFGFNSGANYDKMHDIQPDLTSYDYDAPISEAGHTTPKYDSIRNVISKYLQKKLNPIPAAPDMIEITKIELTKRLDILSLVENQTPVIAENPQTFEQMHQGHGYLLYTHHFNQPISGKLEISGLRDFATLYINGEKIGELNRNTRTYSMQVDIPFNATLEILVENMGRINYGAEIVHNTKGIISPVKINDNEIVGDWNTYTIPLGDSFDFTNTSYRPFITDNHIDTDFSKHRPVLYHGNFNLDETGDTFLDMENWGKGIVYINGKNLGRYWKVGPQQSLFVPGVWLHKGTNTIEIVEQLNETKHLDLKSSKHHELKALRIPN